ncbi:MAG: hypothetical protein HOI95_03700 [Chromatiales bacterium]|jgi:uncharacterized OsmC-like protein|nr:hypothetical protein [Chromatiales bacterium]
MRLGSLKEQILVKVEIEAEDKVRVSSLHESGIAAEPFVDSIALLACALAQCTFGVLRTYGERMDLDGHDMVFVVSWVLVPGPKRVGKMSMDVHWPSLPDSRLDAATRAARHCPVHNTLTREMDVDVFVDH